ncbi:perforin-1-like [Colossoma macropomum]|uniref:perforin-1-like n=1 Tax=Colossoma macropomum TaxID=42526 RepID=UPI001864DB45|nr:perforin-1-like [Colossoma macropomum]
MGWICCYIVSCWIWCSLFSLVKGEEQPELGDPEDCKNAHFVPGYNLGGEGFDVVKMERKGSYVIDMEKWDIGNGSCKTYRNPYLKNAKQKTPAAVEDWRTLPKCSMKVSSKIYDSSEALVNDSTSSISNNWKIGLNVMVKGSGSLGGTHSREAQFSMKKSKKDNFSFTKHVVKCSFYRYKIASSPPLHHEFLQALQSLPKEYDSHSYQSIIDMFGTHFTTGVDLGGKMKAVTAIRTCKAAINGFSGTAVKDCLDVEASGTHKSATLRAEFKHCQELKKKMNTDEKFSSMFNERESEIIGGNLINNDEDLLFSRTSHHNALKQWLDSLKTIPDVVTYTLQPLHSVLDNNHPAREGLKKAVENYILENALKKLCSETCKIGHHKNARDRCACVCKPNQNILSNCCPAEKGLATLKVFNLHAKGLYGDHWTETDGSVEVRYGDMDRRTAIITNNINPCWKESFEFGPVKLSIGKKLSFKVYDQDTYWNSELLGECSFDLRSGQVTDTCCFKNGTFSFSYIVKCAPSLQGPKCADYSPFPMDTHLATIFHSRNGILAKDMWKLQAAHNYSNNPYFKGYF